MDMFRKIFAMLVISSFVWGCIGINDSDDSTILSVSETEILVQAEFTSENDKCKTVVIRSNRSWFAHLDDVDHPIDPADPDAKVKWGTLSVNHHQNLTNTIDETQVQIIFNENYSADRVNGLLNIYCEGKIMQSIPVTQEGLDFRIMAQAQSDFAQCDADTVAVSVDCNTSWTARVSEESTANVTIDCNKGFRNGSLNVIFDENFSETEDKTAKVIFSAKNCEDYVLTITQNKAVPYFFVLPEYDGKVLSGETSASVKIRSNSAWSAEVVESQLEDFVIVNPSGEKGTSLAQDVKVTFKANPENDPFTIKKTKIKFNVQGVLEPVEYVFSQRGCFVVSFDDVKAFSPEIPNTLVSASGQPSNMSRPGRVNTDVDVFSYKSGDLSVNVELSQYIRYDSAKTALYVMGAGKYPYIKISGIDGLTIKEVSLGCSRADAAYAFFAGNIVADDHLLESKTTVEYSPYLEQVNWTSAADGSLYYIDFDLSSASIDQGRGCTIRTSSKNGASDTVNKTKMYVETITFKYL